MMTLDTVEEDEMVVDTSWDVVVVLVVVVVVVVVVVGLGVVMGILTGVVDSVLVVVAIDEASLVTKIGFR